MRSSGDRLEVLKPMVFAIHPHFILITLDPISCGFCSWQNITISWGWSKCSPGGGKLHPLFAQQVTRRCPWFPSSWGYPNGLGWFVMENPMRIPWKLGWFGGILMIHLILGHLQIDEVSDWWVFLVWSYDLVTFREHISTWLRFRQVSPRNRVLGNSQNSERMDCDMAAWQKGSIYGGPMKKSMAKSCVDWWAGFICHMSDGIPVEWGRPGMGVEGGLLRVSQRRKARPLGR